MNITMLVGDYTFTDKDVEAIVSKELPEWKKGCDNLTVGGMLLHQDAFGHSMKELLLLALAIKYAKRTGKLVTIAPDVIEPQASPVVQ